MVKELFENEPDMDDTIMQDEEDDYLYNRPRSNSKGKFRGNSSRRKRPSISVMPNHDHSEDTSGSHKNNTSSSSHSSMSSNGSLGNRKSKHERKVIPCTIVLDLIE